MRKILLALGGLVVLLIVAVLVVPPLIPTAAYKRQLLERISTATGRPARIDGDFGFAILPELSLYADKVALANTPGAHPADMLTIGRLSLRVALMPLFSGNVVVRSLVLDRPVVHLSVDKGGRPNWRFAGSPSRPAPGAAPGGRAFGLLKGLSLSGVRIVNGTITYANARTDARYEADAVNLDLSLPALDKPMAADGSLVWRKEKIGLRLRVARAAALLAGTPTALDAAVTAAPLTVKFNGTVKPGRSVAANGALSLVVPSVRQLAAWAGTPLRAGGSAFGGFKLQGAVAIDGADIAVRQAAFSLDEISGKGDLRLDAARARPYVAAKLILGKVDLDPYLTASSAAPARAAAGRGPSPAGARAPAAAGAAPIEVAPLRRLDGNFDLTLAGLTMRPWVLGPSHIAVTLQTGRLAANLDRTTLYGGKAQARIIVDAEGAAPRLALSGDMTGVQAAPLLTAAAGTARLEGTTDLALQVSGRGRTEREMLATLSGSGRVRLRNGAIRGVDLVGLMHSVANALSSLSAARLPTVTHSADKTAFSELSGSYTIRNGVLFNNDLSLQSPSLKATGRGSVNLLRRDVDYRLEAKLYTPSKIRIGGVTMSELTVPIIVTGPWDHLSYRPDLTAALRDVAKGKALQQLEKVIPGGKTGKGLGGLLQNLPGSNAAPHSGNVLQQLFGR